MFRETNKKILNKIKINTLQRLSLFLHILYYNIAINLLFRYCNNLWYLFVYPDSPRGRGLVFSDLDSGTEFLEGSLVVQVHANWLRMDLIEVLLKKLLAFDD